MILSERHERILLHGLERIPTSGRAEAEKYCRDRLRPILKIEDHDVHSALGAAADRFQRRYALLTTVTKDDVRQKVLARYDDKIGEPIEPEPMD